jgi:pimeloyl-ACP methyl ester carboxylesterase
MAYIRPRIPLLAESEKDLHDGRERALHLADIAGIAVPTLLIAGADSPAVIAAILAAIAAKLPQARRLIVPGAAHMLPITHPETVATAIRSFLDRTPAGDLRMFQ